MWVVDGEDAKVYSYNMPMFSGDSSLSALSLGVTTHPALALVSGTISYSVNVNHDVESVTVAPAVNQEDATFVVSPADADTVIGGHQVNLSEGENEITVTVTAEDGSKTTYTLTVTRRGPTRLVATWESRSERHASA